MNLFGKWKNTKKRGSVVGSWGLRNEMPIWYSKRRFRSNGFEAIPNTCLVKVFISASEETVASFDPSYYEKPNAKLCVFLLHFSHRKFNFSSLFRVGFPSSPCLLSCALYCLSLSNQCRTCSLFIFSVVILWFYWHFRYISKSPGWRENGCYVSFGWTWTPENIEFFQNKVKSFLE